jgi:hypothetical protein
LFKLQFITLLLLCFAITSLTAQDPVKVKFGKISSNDRLLMTAPGVDSSAEAYVLHDAMNVEFLLDNGNYSG